MRITEIKEIGAPENNQEAEMRSRDLEIWNKQTN